MVFHVACKIGGKNGFVLRLMPDSAKVGPKPAGTGGVSGLRSGLTNQEVDYLTEEVDWLTNQGFLKELGGAPYSSVKTRLKYLGSLNPVS